MDALSNARIAVENSGEGMIPFTPPRARHSKTGESVEYVFDPKKKWFVLRASYGRSEQAADLLIDAKYYAYVAMRNDYRMVNGRVRKCLKELIPNILFAYIEKDEIERLLSRRKEEPSPVPQLAQITTFYYNHFLVEEGKNPPLQIPESQMWSFIQITSSKDENIVFVNDRNLVHVKKDDFVNVKEGKFKNCFGKVIRVAGQQRVGLELAGFGWIATSYIPTAFLEIISKEDYENRLETIKNQN